MLMLKLMMSSTESTIRTNFRFYSETESERLSASEGGRERKSGALMYAELAVVFGKERFVIQMQWVDKKLAKGAAAAPPERESMKIEKSMRTSSSCFGRELPTPTALPP